MFVDKGWKLEMIFLESVDSTHKYLKKYINQNGYTIPTAIITQDQTDGIGSRDNRWDGESGNLYFSFVIKKNLLPLDLPLQSTSIYFSYILKEILAELNSKVWLKWPNDFFIQNDKIGGTITSVSNDLIYCGIGLNLKNKNNAYKNLDIQITIDVLLNQYFDRILQKIKWKKIFSKYRIEFENSKQYKTTIDNKKVSLNNAFLNEDGSINISNKKVFSLR